MTTVSLAGTTHVALFCTSRLQMRGKSTLPLAEMVLPLEQDQEEMGAKSRWPVLEALLLSPSLKEKKKNLVLLVFFFSLSFLLLFLLPFYFLFFIFYSSLPFPYRDYAILYNILIV